MKRSLYRLIRFIQLRAPLKIIWMELRVLWRPNSTWRLTVRAQEIKPLVAALSEAGGQLVELWKGVDHTLGWPIEGSMIQPE